MIKSISYSSILFLLLFFSACKAEKKEDPQARMERIEAEKLIDSLSAFFNPSYQQYEDTWVKLSEGASYMEKRVENAPLGDSKISILKIDPKLAEFEIKSATQNDNQALCVVDYAEKFNYNIVINAGMYDVRNYLKSKALLINDQTHQNNSKLYPEYNMMICANPRLKDLPNFSIHDLTLQPWNLLKKQYHSYAQGLRMIDGNGQPLSWNKKNQICSQLAVAEDKNGIIYFIFTRSPYSQNFLIEFMMEMHLKNAIYMEGGPQTSLFVDVADYRIEKVGSFVSDTYPTNSNVEFWPLPNVIGVRLK